MDYYDADYYDGADFEAAGSPPLPSAPDGGDVSPYFDGCYFDGSYFDASECVAPPPAEGSLPPRSRPARRTRLVTMVQVPETFLDDEEALLVLEAF